MAPGSKALLVAAPSATLWSPAASLITSLPFPTSDVGSACASIFDPWKLSTALFQISYKPRTFVAQNGHACATQARLPLVRQGPTGDTIFLPRTMLWGRQLLSRGQVLLRPWCKQVEAPAIPASIWLRFLHGLRVDGAVLCVPSHVETQFK